MPALGAVATALTTPGSAPYSLFAGPYDLINSVPFETIRLEDLGTHEVGMMEFDVIDMALAAVLRDGDIIRFEDNALATTRWCGEVTSRVPTVIASGRAIHLTARHISYVLDRSLVPADSRVNTSTGYAGFTDSDSDRCRIDYLLAVYGSRLPSRDASKIQQLRACLTGFNNGTDLMPQQFQGMTLRQALDAACAQSAGAGTFVAIGPATATAYVEAAGRLRYFDGVTFDNGAAPYSIRIGTPGGGEMSPEDLNIEYDTAELVNAYYVKGATPAGSGWVIDRTSILAYGRREDYIDAPDADTAEKRDAVGRAALSDAKDPSARGSFTAKSPYDGWAAGQSLSIVSAPQFNISAPTTFRIAGVVTTFLAGSGSREYDVQFGATRASLLRAA